MRHRPTQVTAIKIAAVLFGLVVDLWTVAMVVRDGWSQLDRSDFPQLQIDYLVLMSPAYVILFVMVRSRGGLIIGGALTPFAAMVASLLVDRSDSSTAGLNLVWAPILGSAAVLVVYAIEQVVAATRRRRGSQGDDALEVPPCT